jgi:hypothetical protein
MQGIDLGRPFLTPVGSCFLTQALRLCLCALLRTPLHLSTPLRCVCLLEGLLIIPAATQQPARR